MRLTKCSIKNFGSYESFDLDFSNLGLVLVSGDTGAGKSTIPDIAAWILFGETSKNVNADGVRTWGCDEATQGEIQVENGSDAITIVRIRGKASENDLYFYDNQNPAHQIRGKNILETQKLLDERLGVNAELYFTSAYFHQFSSAERFFTAKPTERREIFEKIADQSFAITLSDAVTEDRKTVKKDIEKLKAELHGNTVSLEGHQKSLENAQKSASLWEGEQARKIAAAQAKSDSFEQDKEKRILALFASIEASEQLVRKDFETTAQAIEVKRERIERAKEEKGDLKAKSLILATSLEQIDKQLHAIKNHGYSTCPTCASVLSEAQWEERVNTLISEFEEASHALDAVKKQISSLDLVINTESEIKRQEKALQEEKSKNDRLLHKIETEKSKVLEVNEEQNTFTDQIKTLKADLNPHFETIERHTHSIQNMKALINTLSLQVGQKEERLASLNLLYDLSFDLRGALLSKVIAEIETDANRILESHFDAEIRVRFELVGADKLDVRIEKSGHTCSFPQLSGGQRCLLKLAFWLAVKKAAENKASIHFPVLSFDEALHGLDESLKEKAFSLLQELETTHETILVIEHSELFKTQFTKNLHVSLVGDMSCAEMLSE